MNEEPLFSLRGRVALVTGAAGWLGEPMVVALARQGAHVVMVSRRASVLGELEARLKGQGLSVEACPIDILDAEQVHFALQGMRQKHKRLDVLVNNASAAPPGPHGLDTADASFAAATEISVTAAWRLTIGALDLFRLAVRDSGDASVINIASMYGKVSPEPAVYRETGQSPSPPFYGAAKAGLLQLNRWLACNLGPEGIRVNCISPGPFPQWNSRERAPEFVARLDRKTALGRVGQRDEIKGAVLFLASKASTFVTGADLPVDGGWTSW